MTQSSAELQGQNAGMRTVPAVGRLLSTEPFQRLMNVHPRVDVLRATRKELERLRQASRTSHLVNSDIEVEAIHRRVSEALVVERRPYYRRVINATGIVLHTGLGRAPLAARAADAVRSASTCSLRVELDLETGARGGRDEGCASIIRELLGCEAAAVVNNNAAATLVMLAAMARGKRVVVSNGELVEIGGSYRVPEIMAESGASLVAVGTTNRTHLADYQAAIGPDTGLILKVHTSNYRVRGFTNEVAISELVALGRDRDVPVAHDIGSGLLLDLPGVDGDEPKVRASLSAGADIVCFSGDKLLGGPQAGILAGNRDAVERCRRHPLYRAMRPSRLTYVALESTLRIYFEGDDVARQEIPVLSRLMTSDQDLRRRARKLARRLSTVDRLFSRVVRCDSQAGSGSMPARGFASWGVQSRPAVVSAERLAADLRTGDPAVLCRLSDGALIFDVRTIDDDECEQIAGRLRSIQRGTAS